MKIIMKQKVIVLRILRGIEKVLLKPDILNYSC